MNTKDVKVDLDALESVANSALAFDFLSLSAFFTAANPAAVLELIRRLREAESRLHEVATHCATVESELAACREKAHSHSFIGRAIAQEERACRAEDALVDIVNQIRKSSPIDDHGHSFLMNMAYLKAVELLNAARAKEGGAV